MLYDIVYALIIVRNRKKLNNSKMIDYRIGSWYNITNVKRCAFGSGIPADSVIEITVTKPGQEPVTSNIRVLQSDLELLDSLKDIN